MNRRHFLATTLAGGALWACRGRRDAPSLQSEAHVTTPPAKRSILILGGTGFIGPHIVDAARARGHRVTLFNRGKTHPGMFPDLEELHGDRDGHLEALRGRRWDAVIDTSGFVPRIVRASTELLAPSVGQYIFISTISVYASHAKVGQDETGAVQPLEDPTSEDSKKDYGALKALCEQAATTAMPGRVCAIRPGVIVGPLDPTGRFTHWVVRTAAGGEVLAPGRGTDRAQWIDVRDLAAWTIHAVEDNVTGTYNALGPDGGATMKALLDTCNEVGGGKATITWVDADFLAAHDVSGWKDMPLWLPPEGELAGIGTTSNARARARGLEFRPMRETVRDTLAWARALPASAPAEQRDSGIDPTREAAVLAAWHARAG